MLSRRSAAALAVLAALTESVRGQAFAQAGQPGAANPAEPNPNPPPGVQPVPKDEVVAVMGQPVMGPDGKTQIGRLIDVLVDAMGRPQAAVIDIGGFMGVGSRTIAVQWKALRFAPSSDQAPITLDLSLDQVKAMPAYKGLSSGKPAPVVVPPMAPNQPVSH